MVQKKYRQSFYLTALFLLVLFLFSGCNSREEKFIPGDIKDDFCGAFINFQYCKCAFHNEFCDAIGLKRSEAKKYVDEQYKKWVENERGEFEKSCFDQGGWFESNKCKYCEQGYIMKEGNCEQQEVSDEEAQSGEGAEASVCKYDSDCAPVCEGSVAWKRGCNPRENVCEKTFETDCSVDVENFGGVSVSKTCVDGQCARDESALANKKIDLENEQKKISDEVKEINKGRDDIRDAMMVANKNCINGIADMTNVAIVEFATRVASIMAGGLPKIADVSVDYAGEALNRLYNYQSGEPTEKDKKLKPEEYIKLNCDLYNYFKNVLAASDKELDDRINSAKAIEEQLKLLP